MLLRLMAAATMLSASLAAHADTTFDFTFGNRGDVFNGSGVFTATLVSGDEYQIVDVTGTTDTGNGKNRVIAGLDTIGSFEGNDNLLFLASDGEASLDYNGVSYLLRNGAQINLFDDGEVLQRVSGVVVTETVPLSVTSVTPEPSSIALFTTGLVGMAGVMRKRLA